MRVKDRKNKQHFCAASTGVPPLEPPAPPASAQVVKSQKAQAQHDEWKRGAIVQARFTAESEAQSIAVERIGDLNIRGEHRIGRREYCAQQNCGPYR